MRAGGEVVRSMSTVPSRGAEGCEGSQGRPAELRLKGRGELSGGEQLDSPDGHFGRYTGV